MTALHRFSENVPRAATDTGFSGSFIMREMACTGTLPVIAW